MGAPGEDAGRGLSMGPAGGQAVQGVECGGYPRGAVEACLGTTRRRRGVTSLGIHGVHPI